MGCVCVSFRNFLGITNNPAESWNNLVHQLNNRKRKTKDGIVQILYHYCRFLVMEITRAYHGIGNYELKDYFQVCKASEWLHI